MAQNAGYYIGIDIGSVSVDAAVLSDSLDMLEKHYIRTHGRPMQATLEALTGILGRFGRENLKGMAFTGGGGEQVAGLLGCRFFNEVAAQSAATGRLHPGVKTIIEIGGEDSKLIILDYDAATGKPRIADFAMNTICAAGTGSFLDQQAQRLGVNIEGEFGEMALKSERPPRVAGRCSVFAKTDMIHLQQEGTPDYDIIAGLCFALARNFKSNIGKGKEFAKPIAFQGGVAANKGIVRAFTEVLGLQPGELIVPEHFAFMGAIGAVILLKDSGEKAGFTGLEPLEDLVRNGSPMGERLKPLSTDDYICVTESVPITGVDKVDAFVGVDVGSISTNVVVIDREGRVLSRRYLMTAGRPLKAVTQGLYEVGQEIGDRVVVRGCATTGSGRYMTGAFIGADVVKNEITSHAVGAGATDVNVDTIFEIGGQDAKYISLEKGVVVNFAMNKVCAAGTGSFLEEQAEKLDMNIVREFGETALDSKAPARLGERCTVFMESELNRHQQQGVEREDLVAGLAYSVVQNYVQRVVEGRKIGDVIFFQGGVAANRAVKAAFEGVTGKPVRVPPHHDVLGAVGAALIARENPNPTSNFKGFDLRERTYELSGFECKACSNHCEIRRVVFAGEKPLHYGSRCGKFDDAGEPGKGDDLPDLFERRKQFLLTSYPKDKPDRPNGVTIGVPQIGTFFEYYPFYKAYLTELGYEIVLSTDTNRNTINMGTENVAGETCLPIKVAHGHVLDLIERGVKRIFLPSVLRLEMESDRMMRSYACPYIQGLPYLIRGALDLDARGVETLIPVINLQPGREHANKALREFAINLGHSSADADNAITHAWEAMDAFRKSMTDAGREVMSNLKDDQIAMVVVSRPYNGCDSGMNLNLPGKLRRLGVLAIPMDFLPADIHELGLDYPHMYWKYGQRILSVARVIAKDPRLNAIYITNFGCGPDSFIMKYFGREIGDSPYLTIEIDEHSADVGIITRCEAYLDSLKNRRSIGSQSRMRTTGFKYSPSRGDNHKTVWVPHMGDHADVLSAAMRSCGINAQPMPMSDQESLELGRANTSGKECYPCILTTGDMLKVLKQPGIVPSKTAMFIADALGPCRFGQYNKFQRILLDDLGYSDVEMMIYDQNEGFYKDAGAMGNTFLVRTWKALILMDLLEKQLYHTRPYEKEPGSAEKAYDEMLQRLVRRTEAGGELDSLAQEIREAMSGVPVDRSKPRPKVGIVGEIYVRSNDFSNNFAIRRLESFGCEVVTPTIQEWINYIAYCRQVDCRTKGHYGALAKEWLQEFVRFRQANRYSDTFDDAGIPMLRESKIPDVLRLSRSYLPESVRGEGHLSLGRCVEYIHEGLSGLVNIVPFNCMPGTMVNALLENLRRDFDKFPVLKVVCDGHVQAGEQTLMEAFAHQAKQRMEADNAH
ncbi:MAG TPA: acyl-CoA dehydratase activase [Candidatus Brocadiia bacterium]|nr:acyl-CoA dehydratase activase [Candidatus Brocadiia bacterium]